MDTPIETENIPPSNKKKLIVPVVVFFILSLGIISLSLGLNKKRVVLKQKAAEQNNIDPREEASPYGFSGTPDYFYTYGHSGLNVFQESGAKWIRSGLSWNYIQPKSSDVVNGTFNWNLTDDIVNSYLNLGSKLELIFIGNILYDPNNPNSTTKTNLIMPDLTEKIFLTELNKRVSNWEYYLYKTVERYKDRVKYWEIWNEQDQNYWFNEGYDQVTPTLAPSPNPVNYAKLLQKSYAIIKQADPTAQVLLGGMSLWDPNYLGDQSRSVNQKTKNFLTNFFNTDADGNGQPDKFNNFDTLAIHPYVAIPTDAHSDSLSVYLGDFLSFIKSLDPSFNKDIWLNEIGFSGCRDGLNESPALMEEEARVLERTYSQTINQPSGLYKKVFWYKLYPNSKSSTSTNDICDSITYCNDNISPATDQSCSSWYKEPSFGVYKTLAHPRTDSIIFEDNFDRENVFDGNWQFQSSSLAGNFVTVSSISNAVNVIPTGTKALQVTTSSAGGLQAIIHSFSPALTNGVFKVGFYDYGDNRSAGSVVSISNFGAGVTDSYIIIQVDKDTDNYIYRLNSTTVDSGIRRTAGWHVFEFRLETCGSAYGAIDNQPLSFKFIENFKFLSQISIGRVWRGVEGYTYFDNLAVSSYAAPETNLSQQQILDSWSDIVYARYKNIDLPSLVATLKDSRNQGRARLLIDQALMYLYYYYTRCEVAPNSSCNSSDLVKAKQLIRGVIDNYEDSQGNPIWGRIWLSPVPMSFLAFDVWFSWKDLDVSTREKFQQILAKEADYWVWVLNEIKNNPNGETIPVEVGRRSGQKNISLITTNVNSNDHLNDTRAEENGATAQMLAFAASMLPNHPNANAWNEAAKCFAFHTFSKGETACGITTRTVSNDFVLGNHGFSPSPMYGLAGITELQQGQLAYIFAGKPVPAEFYHNLGDINGEIWKKNETDCGCTEAGCFSINAYCHGGQDWGDNNFLISAEMINHWAKLASDSGSRQTAENLLNSLLKNMYYKNKGLIWSKLSSSVDDNEPISSFPTHWFKNLEIHAQESAKVWATNNINNSTFRSKYFPASLFPNPTPTLTPAPTRTPIPTQTPTPTPVNVIYSSKKGLGGPVPVAHFGQLGIDWFYNWSFVPGLKDPNGLGTSNANNINWNSQIWEKFVPLFLTNGKDWVAPMSDNYTNNMSNICRFTNYCQGSYYLVGNEPNLCGFDWAIDGNGACLSRTESIARSVRVYGEIIKMIKGKDQNAKIILLGLASGDSNGVGTFDTNYFNEFVDKWKAYWLAEKNDPVLKNLADAITGWHIHFYGLYSNCPANDSFAQNVKQSINQKMQAVFGKTVLNQEIWITEMGSLVGIPTSGTERDKFKNRMRCLVNVFENSNAIDRYAWFYHGCGTTGPDGASACYGNNANQPYVLYNSNATGYSQTDLRPIYASLPVIVSPTNTPSPTATPTLSPCQCPVGMMVKSKGNSDCNLVIDLRDLMIWREERTVGVAVNADFNCDGVVDIRDLMLWRENHN